MKKFFLLSLFTVIIIGNVSATIRRVGYFGPAVNGVDYSSFQLAHDAATPGDTIMMHPGSQFGAVNMSKRLISIGPGYFLSQNAGLQVNTTSMDSTAFFPINIINATANGSVFMGCTFYYNNIIVSGTNVANISFIRCWFNGLQGDNNSLQFAESINNFSFQQCAFKGSVIKPQNNTAVATNMSFLNCLFYTLSGTGVNLCLYFFSNVSHSGLIQNCVFSEATNSTLQFDLNGSWTVNNCIGNFSIGSAFGAGIAYQNCIGTSTQFPVGSGNLQNQTWANIFTLTGSTDGQYTLKSGSPAIGAGIGGTNCGIFGGTTPYKLSGIPNVPTLYSISSPQGNTPTVNTVQINLSTRSNN